MCGSVGKSPQGITKHGDVLPGQGTAQLHPHVFDSPVRVLRRSTFLSPPLHRGGRTDKDGSRDPPSSPQATQRRHIPVEDVGNRTRPVDIRVDDGLPVVL